MGPTQAEEGLGEGAEGLKVYVDQQVALLRNEMLALLADRGKSTCIAPSPSPLQPAVSDEVALEVKSAVVAVSAKHLDQQDAHELGGSIWDCAVVLGLDCLGLGESCLVFLLIVLNGLVQIYFCYVISIGSGMLQDPVGPDVLDALLRYRTGVAHRVENADLVERRSLLRKVCDGDERLHVSGAQRSLLDDLTFFQQQGGGLVLCVLALVCWSAKAIAESGSTLRFAQAVLELRGQCTRVVVLADGGLVLESLSSRDIAKVFLVGIVPRLVLALLLFIIGTLYLSRTSRMEDLLLNAMALGFVLDVDELLFEAFAPHRVRSLIMGLAPLRLTPWATQRPCLGPCPALLRLLGVAVVVLLVHELELRPFHGRLQQALQILCSGHRDFVYGVSPATGVVVAARSAPLDDTWPAAECAVLQLARPELREAFGWSPPRGHCRASEASAAAPALIRPKGAMTLEEVSFSQAEFDYVSSLAKADVQQAGVHQLCRDVDRSPSAELTALHDMVGGVERCEDVRALCHLQNMTRLRALCSLQCECHFTGWSASGFFRTAHHGCPAACLGLAAALAVAGDHDGYSALKCEDVQPLPQMNVTQVLQLLDEDQNRVIHWAELDAAYLRHTVDSAFRTDLWLFDLDGDRNWNMSEQQAFEEVHKLFEQFDRDRDGNLSRTEVQAAIAEQALSSYVDADGDGVLTKAELAAELATEDAVPVVPPWTPVRFSRDPQSGPEFYISGLFEFLRSQPNFRESLQENIAKLPSLAHLNHTQITAHFLHGAKESWVSGEWVLAPGEPHPRGLQYCEFLLSLELQVLLGLDLCNPQGVASLRSICPKSCKCQAGTEECPASCPSVHNLAGQ